MARCEKEAKMKRSCWLAGSLAVALAQAEPVKIIFDTDMGNDVDDAMALCMIHAL